jgi:hypothetical protein
MLICSYHSIDFPFPSADCFWVAYVCMSTPCVCPYTVCILVCVQHVLCMANPLLIQSPQARAHAHFMTPPHSTEKHWMSHVSWMTLQWEWLHGRILYVTYGLVIALRPQTPKHMRGGGSHYTDTSEPVDGNGAENMVTVQARFEPTTFRSLAHRAYVTYRY